MNNYKENKDKLARAFGVELEFICEKSREEMIDIIKTGTGITVRTASYNDKDITQWRLKEDVSIHTENGYLYGMELVTPRLTSWRHLEQLKMIADIFNKYGKVNKSCGMHVHVEIKDAENTQVKKLMKFFAKYEKGINTILPRSRRGVYPDNIYSYDSFAEVTNLKKVFRYLNGKCTNSLLGYRKFAGRGKWNFGNFMRHGTFENRAHSGTLDSEKIEQWVFLTQAMVACGFDCRGQVIRAEDTTETYDIFHMLKNLKAKQLIDADTVKFYKKRHAKLMNDDNVGAV